MNATCDIGIHHYKTSVEHYLKKILAYPKHSSTEANYIPEHFSEALHYVIFNGGKRLRPALLYAVAEGLNIEKEHCHAAAAALELIHGYSLVHDDLPAMDNDDYRRGKLSCHKAFDEATAILVGDGLQTLAFDLLSDETLNPHPPHIQLKMIQILSKACGLSGMISGQVMDMQFKHITISLETLINLHHKKTGALILSAIELAIIIAGCTDHLMIEELKAFGKNFGLLFQVQDDILDMDENFKSSFPNLLGLSKAKAFRDELLEQTITRAHSPLLPQTMQKNLQTLLNYFIKV